MLRFTSVVVLLSAVVAARCEAAEGPLAPEEAPRAMTLPEGFEATLFAGEPDVVQPIAFTFDHRGRLWVVECLSYPKWSTDGTGRDRVSIFEDRDGDGRFDEKTVFLENGSNLTGIAVGFGGVWLCSSPNFVFVPDADGDDRPDGPPRVLLDGWSLKCKHNMFNGLTWGPDGWLYGMNGILDTSAVGRPGTPDDERTRLRCGVWRYHPVRHVFEVVARGTTNPWGLDFDRHGEIFITNCVIKHLFHVVPGGHYERMYGQDLEPHVYGLMKSCADYIHWGGGKWQSSRGGQGIHDAAGGGHAHVGCMIYAGDNWPEAYRGELFTCNLHGNRINRDSLVPKASGYASKRAPDFMLANDTWFRGLELKYGPDGGVYVTDWCDTGECHDYDVCERGNGRIHKITFGKPKPVSVDLGKATDAKLVALHSHRNEWFVRRSRLVLQERAARGKLDPEALQPLNRVLGSADAGDESRLKALWTLYAVGELRDEELVELLSDDSPQIRKWAVRLIVDDRDVSDELLTNLVAMAASEESAVVRLAFASALQRLPVAKRRGLAEALVANAANADDPNLPLMIWYGVEPLVKASPAGGLQLLAKTRIPLVRQHIARRAASAD